MPQEQEIPAPVTITMRLLLATARERLDKVRREAGSVGKDSRSIVESMIAMSDGGVVRRSQRMLWGEEMERGAERHSHPLSTLLHLLNLCRVALYVTCYSSWRLTSRSIWKAIL